MNISALTSSDIEFFRHNDVTKFIQNGQVKPIEHLPPCTKSIVEIDMMAHPHKVPQEQCFDRMIYTYIAENFSRLDGTPDISNGVCGPHEFNPNSSIKQELEVNDNIITEEEIKLWQLLTTEKINLAIADELEIPLGTFHKIKKQLYAKLGVQTKQALTILAIEYNLI